MEGSHFLFIALVQAIHAIVFQLIGLVSPQWYNQKEGVGGLWKQCVGNMCTYLTSEGWLSGVQAMSILGFLAVTVAGVMIVLKMFIMKDQVQILLAAAVASFVGAFFILMSIAVYAGENDGKGLTYGFAFTFSILGMVAAITAGGALLLVMKEEN
ncbi:uncharacterized protein LOC125647776 [Ostrea edulis]|uniref:uncharacterized protein LOC125647776 n=1 Tax=Ostrea edulis TaxID=37623 RepID=UPI002094ED9D|nr:uncharacterized protein LOC125647776 [Ostrea edulis]XP_055997747.1 uncharacterized protein LOC125647776 [Ostrea edulis]XP_055997748.1 uncharacterized protein LOC125647776 [Ostrea edulis]XP_055997749.1 uncharacterized protein LOC125647776 [Ostrea edulis]XP_055997750.1 uncharacterized protein LOC125647776 [Ostrea edulis]XP_055997751.1 uncharacterized protein LOC125647776 [Ostrea edulis]XP_055997752.1 uncharacterized protein LOC125647776 [Ostrea edulis]